MDNLVYVILILSIFGAITYYYLKNKSSISIRSLHPNISGNFNTPNTASHVSQAAINVFLKNAQTNLNDLRIFRIIYFIFLVFFVFCAISAVVVATYYFIIDFKIELSKIVAYTAVFTSNFTCYQFLKEFLKLNKAYNDALNKLMDFKN